MKNRTKPLTHHIIYNEYKDQEVTAPLYPGEHWLCTQLQRRGSLISKGFLKHLRFFIWKHEDSAHDLSEKMKMNDIKSAHSRARKEKS